MQALAALIGGMFIGLFEFFAKYFSKKIAITATLITFITALTATFIAATEAAMSSIAVVIPSEALILVGGFIPSNMNECISVIMSVHIARFIYDMNVRFSEYVVGQ